MLEKRKDLLSSILRNSWLAQLRIDGFAVDGVLCNIVYALPTSSIGELILEDCILRSQWYLENLTSRFALVQHVNTRMLGGRGASESGDKLLALCAQRRSSAFFYHPVHLGAANFPEDGIIDFLFSPKNRREPFDMWALSLNRCCFIKESIITRLLEVRFHTAFPKQT